MCKKVNTAGTDINLFRLECLGMILNLSTTDLELVPVPQHGAQIWAWAPTKRYVQTGMVTKSEQSLRYMYPTVER